MSVSVGRPLIAAKSGIDEGSCLEVCDPAVHVALKVVIAQRRRNRLRSSNLRERERSFGQLRLEKFKTDADFR